MRALAFTVLALGGCGHVDFDTEHDLVEDLEFYFPLDQTAGHRMPDASGNARDGYVWDPVMHMQWQPTGGVIGGALHFDGTGYMSFALFPASESSCGSHSPITGSITLAAWVKFDSFGTWNGYSLSNFAVGEGPGGGSGGGWGLGATNACGAATAGFEVAAGAARYAVVCGTTTLTAGTWHHLAGVFDAGARTMDVYVDGVVDTGARAPGSAPVPSASTVEPTCPYLGAASNQQHLLVGSLDEVHVYSRTLSAQDIAQLAQP